jgi:hypothetical protein
MATIVFILLDAFNRLDNGETYFELWLRPCSCETIIKALTLYILSCSSARFEPSSGQNTVVIHLLSASKGMK